MSRWRRDYPDDGDDAGRYRDEYDVGYEPRRQFGGRYDGDHCKPISSRVGTGRRARIAVETGRPDASAAEDSRKREAELRRLELEARREKIKAEIRRKHEAEIRHRYAGLRTHESSTRRRPSPRRYHSSQSPSSRRDSSDSLAGTDPSQILSPIGPAQPGDEPAYASSPSIAPRMYTETVADHKNYDFQLPVRPQATTYEYVEDVSFLLDAESNGPSGNGSQGSRHSFTGSITEKAILQSRWVGSVDDRGDLRADIGIPAAEPNRAEKPRDPLMRWYHLARPNLNFEEFIAAAQGVLQIPEQKRRDVNELLRYVQRKYEKQRQHGRDLEPNYVSDLYLKDTSSKRSTCVMFLYVLKPWHYGPADHRAQLLPILLPGAVPEA